MNKYLYLTILFNSFWCLSSKAGECKKEQFIHYSNFTIQEVTPTAIVTFAKQFLGVPYKFGGSNPHKGFDCSGFVNYVFKNFHFAVPRSSAGFKNEGINVPLTEAQTGDVILFRGTNPKVKSIGHVGIVTSNKGQPLRFIHASSGKSRCVTETSLSGRYQIRFVKIVRLTP
ncbi:C40 family peptidase [Olivibacter sp. CPCC 100613]|uniref:C40 family peptidase n=1 Tax=Olivibacter sp. CPCC 100613 TaxID=3079931 RepID=UPI002FF7DB4A